MGTLYVNADGLAQNYGTRAAEDTIPGSPSTYGSTSELILDFDYSTVANIGAVTTRGDIPSIPAGAIILSAHLQVTADFTGATTGMNVGLEKADGSTAIDLDGFIVGSAIGVNANLVAGANVVGDGALIGATVGDVAGYITVVEHGGGAFTAGAGRLVVRYVD